MKEKYIDDIKEIKQIMQRSSRFISLSGLSGILVGIYATFGAYLAYNSIFSHADYFVFGKVEMDRNSIIMLVLIAGKTLVMSILLASYLTARRVKELNVPRWDHQTRNLLVNLSIPLIVGGIVCLILLFRGYPGLTPAFTLIFYGLALTNASKYTHSEIKSLGLVQIFLGLCALYFIAYSLVIWVLGFGLMHIIWGILIRNKYN